MVSRHSVSKTVKVPGYVSVVSFCFVSVCFLGMKSHEGCLLCFLPPEKKGPEKYVPFKSSKMYLCPEASNVLSLYVLVPPTLCCLVFHISLWILTFFKAAFSGWYRFHFVHYTSIICSVSSWAHFMSGLSFICHSKNGLLTHISSQQSHS